MATNNFEEALKELQNLSEKIKAPDTNLEESIKCYEKGMEYYNTCNEILKNAKQKIEMFEGEV